MAEFTWGRTYPELPSHEPYMCCRVLLINPANEILLIRRSEKNETNKNKLELAGGKIDDGEKSEDAAVRETHEETGITIQIPEDQKLQKIDIPDRNRTVYLAVIHLSEIPEVTLSDEHTESMWITQEKALERDDLKEETKLILETLQVH